MPAEGQNLIRASIIDTSERKRAELALRESEEKFRALFEGSSLGVVLHDDNELLEVNSAAVPIIMRRNSPEELLGRPSWIFCARVSAEWKTLSEEMAREAINEMHGDWQRAF